MHRFINNKGIILIKRFEGFKAKTYVCAAGYLTIGYGHKLLSNDHYNNISIKQAEIILQKDVMSSERAVLKYINTPLSDNQFAALVSFTFNLGGAALQRSSLRQKINYELYKEAGEEFLKWIYARGKKLKGLYARRQAEKELFCLSVNN